MFADKLDQARSGNGRARKVSKEEAEALFTPEGDCPRLDPEILESLINKRYSQEIDHLLELRKKKETMGLKERQSALNASNAVTGVMGVWCLIGLVMLGKSCINTDPGPKFKV